MRSCRQPAQATPQRVALIRAPSCLALFRETRKLREQSEGRREYLEFLVSFSWYRGSESESKTVRVREREVIEEQARPQMRAPIQLAPSRGVQVLFFPRKSGQAQPGKRNRGQPRLLLWGRKEPSSVASGGR
jgi:hypothetical protein